MKELNHALENVQSWYLLVYSTVIFRRQDYHDGNMYRREHFTLQPSNVS